MVGKGFKMGTYPFNIWYVCKLCRQSFQNVDQFIYHKKEKHLLEFRSISCLVFEETTFDQEYQPNNTGRARGDLYPSNENNQPAHSSQANPPRWNRNRNRIRHTSNNVPSDNDENSAEYPEPDSVSLRSNSNSQDSDADADADGFIGDADREAKGDDGDDGEESNEDFEREFIPQDFLVASLSTFDVDSLDVGAEQVSVSSNKNQSGVVNVSRSQIEEAYTPNPFVLVRRLKSSEISSGRLSSLPPRRSKNKNTTPPSFPVWDLSDLEIDVVEDDVNADVDVTFDPFSINNNDSEEDQPWRAKRPSRPRPHQSRGGRGRNSPKKRKAAVARRGNSFMSQKPQKLPLLVAPDDAQQYNSHGQFIFPTQESEIDNYGEPMSLTEWLHKYKSLNPANRILLIPDPFTEPEKTEPLINAVGPENPVSCKLCSEKIKSEDELKIHVKYCWSLNKKRHVHCVACDKTVSVPKYLKKHIINSHGEEEFKSLGYVFKCHLCSEEFLKEVQLWDHKKSHRQENDFSAYTDNDNNNADGVIAIGEPNAFVCRICSKTFSSQTGLRTHRKAHSEKRPYVCPEPDCNQAFKYKDNLRSHLQTHSTSNFDSKGGAKAKVPFTTEDEIQIVVSPEASDANFSLVEWLLKQKIDKDGNVNDSSMIFIEPDPTAPPTVPLPNIIPTNIDDFPILNIDPLAPNLTQNSTQDFAYDLAKNLTQNLTSNLTMDMALDLAQNLTQNLNPNRTHNMSFDSDSTQDLSPNLVMDLARNSTPDLARNSTSDLAQNLTQDSEPNLSQNSSGDFTTRNFSVSHETPIVCKLCCEKLVTETEVKIHVTHCWSLNKKKHRYCIHCNLTLSSFTSFRLHTLRFHGTAEEKDTKLNKFPCSLCPKKFQFRFVLMQHMETHKSKDERDLNRPYICEYCGRACLSRGDLNKHVRIHYTDRPFSCPHENCPNAFKSKRGLRSHLLHTHSDLKTFVCPFPFCEKAFKTNQQLKQHSVHHSGERSHVCNENGCGKRFASLGILKRHIKARHGEGDGDFQCEICLRRFKLKTYMVSHMVVHSDDKPIKCTYVGCELAFKRRRELIEHVRIHTGEQPYQCDACGKSFARVSHFHRHMRLHKSQ